MKGTFHGTTAKPVSSTERSTCTFLVYVCILILTAYAQECIEHSKSRVRVKFKIGTEIGTATFSTPFRGRNERKTCATESEFVLSTSDQV